MFHQKTPGWRDWISGKEGTPAGLSPLLPSREVDAELASYCNLWERGRKGPGKRSEDQKTEQHD